MEDNGNRKLRHVMIAKLATLSGFGPTEPLNKRKFMRKPVARHVRPAKAQISLSRLEFLSGDILVLVGTPRSKVWH